MLKTYIVSIIVFFCYQQVFAWGALGHKTSAEIAWQIMDSNTKQKISEALKKQDFSEISTWADATRAEPNWKFTIWYHFEKAPDNYTYLENLKRQDDKYKKIGGLIEALYVAESMYLSSTSSNEEKENALKFLVHFISDIHQPLHTGRVEDNSGNKIPVKWLGLDLTLHQIWDSQIIYLGHKNIFDAQAEVEQKNSYAKYLLEKYKDMPISESLFKRYDDWMHESMVPRTDAYNYKDESEQKYTERFIDIIDQRIYLAGLRIAHVLTRIVNRTPQNNELKTLEASIIEIVGKFYEFISLKPKPVLTEKANLTL